jgi:hypothetical protein
MVKRLGEKTELSTIERGSTFFSVGRAALERESTRFINEVHTLR